MQASTQRLLSVVALAAAVAWAREKGPPRISGQSLVKAEAEEIYLAPNGLAAATLGSPEPSNELGVPQDIKLGSLWLTSVDGSVPARRLGGGVPNLSGSVLFSADSQYVAFQAGYSIKHGAGELRLARVAGGDPETLGDGVTFFSLSPTAEWIAWVSQGVLNLRKLAGGEPMRVTDGVSLVEFGPKGTPAAGTMLIKRAGRSGGALLTDDLATGKLTAIARGVGAFGFAPTGDGYAFQAQALLPATFVDRPLDAASGHGPGVDAPGLYRVIGTEAPKLVTKETVTDFKFSPNGKRFVYLTVPTSGTAGDLYRTDGGPAELVASRVSDVRFTPEGSLVLLGNISHGSSAGTMGLLTPDGKLIQIAQNVRRFSLTPKGGYILYSQEVFNNGAFSLGFAIHKVSAPAPTKSEVIDEGVYGYAADASESKVAYKAHCIDNGKSCGLFVVDLSAAAATGVQIASQIGAFEFAPDGLLVISARQEAKLTGRTLFSLGYMRPELHAPIQTLDDQMTGHFTVAGGDRKRAIYLVDERGREGLFTVALSQPPAPLPVTKAP